MSFAGWISFWCSTAVHVFPGFADDVQVARGSRQLDSIDNLEQNPFNPLAKGGAPRWTQTDRYRSGIVGIPPK